MNTTETDPSGMMMLRRRVNASVNALTHVSGKLEYKRARLNEGNLRKEKYTYQFVLFKCQQLPALWRGYKHLKHTNWFANYHNRRKIVIYYVCISSDIFCTYWKRRLTFLCVMEDNRKIIILMWKSTVSRCNCEIVMSIADKYITAKK